MAILSEELKRHPVSVSIPNHEMHAHLTWPDEVTVSINGGYVARIGDVEAGVQLGRLARLLFTHRAAVYEQVKREVLEPNSPPPETPKELQFREAYNALAVTVSSADSLVTVTSVGLTNWAVTVAQGASDRVGSPGIAAAATDAANKMIQQLKTEVKELRHDTFKGHP